MTTGCLVGECVGISGKVFDGSVLFGGGDLLPQQSWWRPVVSVILQQRLASASMFSVATICPAGICVGIDGGVFSGSVLFGGNLSSRRSRWRPVALGIQRQGLVPATMALVALICLAGICVGIIGDVIFAGSVLFRSDLSSWRSWW